MSRKNLGRKYRLAAFRQTHQEETSDEVFFSSNAMAFRRAGVTSIGAWYRAAKRWFTRDARRIKKLRGLGKL